MAPRTLCSGATMALIASMVLVAPAVADVAANPARIQAAACGDVGPTVVVLDDVVGEWLPDQIGAGDPVAYPVRASRTQASPVGYQELFASTHSLVVDLAPGEGPILCGDLRGYPMTATDIAIGLGELNHSGFSGIATLHDNGDATVDVAVYLTTRDAWIGDID